MFHGYTDRDGFTHLYDSYNDAFNAWASDNNAGFAEQPNESGLNIVDHRTTAVVAAPSRRPAEGSYAAFIALGQ